jgi:hypothetical protein
MPGNAGRRFLIYDYDYDDEEEENEDENEPVLWLKYAPFTLRVWPPPAGSAENVQGPVNAKGVYPRNGI